MIKKTVPDLKEIFKQAAEIAQQVPERMQEAAFNRALEMLTANSSIGPGVQPNKNSTASKARAGEHQETQTADPVRELINSIDSTQHPGVISSSKALDRALMILQIALNDHNVDGLSACDIAKILTDKFRISTNYGAVSMALGRAATLVNRIPHGHSYMYRIMGPGEAYLAHLKESGATSITRNNSKDKRNIRTKRTTKKNAREIPGNDTQVTNKQSLSKNKVRACSLAPKAAIIELVDAGFFSTPQTGATVQGYLKLKRGFTMGADQLRLALLRLARDGVLDRNENQEGNYEYTKPTA